MGPKRSLLEQCNSLAEGFTDNTSPSIAQLVERWTVVGQQADIHRSLVQIRLEGVILLDKRLLQY